MNADFATVPYVDIGDVPYAVWEAEMARYPSSPLIPVARDLYAITKGHTALALAHMKRESSFETDRQLLTPQDHNGDVLSRLPFIGEVEIRKVTKVFKRSPVISVSSILCSVEVTQPNPLVLESNTGHPSIQSAVERNTLEPTGVSRGWPTIRSVLRISRTAQVLSSVVQAVTVPMINLDVAFSSQDKSMKQDECFTIPTTRVPAARVALHSGPLMSQHSLRVSSVNNSCLALGKRNQNQASGGRLWVHAMSFHRVPALGRRQSRRGLSRALIIPYSVDSMGFSAKGVK